MYIISPADGRMALTIGGTETGTGWDPLGGSSSSSSLKTFKT